MALDYYAILGVQKEATDREIKSAYRKLARELHPDINPSEEAAEEFKKVTVAYELLSDPEKRRIIDMGGDPLAQAGGGAGGFGGFGGGAFEDIFETVFNMAGMGGMGGSRYSEPRSRVQPGGDSLTRLRLSLEECYAGGLKELDVTTYVLCEDCKGSGSETGTEPEPCPYCEGSGHVQEVQRSILGQMLTTHPCPHCVGTGQIISDPCRSCQGDGRVRRNRTVTVKVPAGVGTGMRIRLVGQGDTGPGGGAAGDLYVEVQQEPHPIFTREGDDLHCTIDISMVDAALGCEVDIELPSGNLHTVRIPTGTQPASVLHQRGQGMPNVRSGRQGDLLAHINVSVPTELGDEQKEALQKLRELEPDSARVLSEEEDSIFTRLKNAFQR